METVSRRELLRAIAALGLPYSVSASSRQSLPQFEVVGDGPTLIAFNRAPKGYFSPLTKNYRVVVIDYPPPNPSPAFINGFTADRVCSDILAVADAVGAERFAWFGFSWGAVVGLQLASRTRRLTALALGAWPPLGGQYRETLAFTESEAKGQPALYVTFYRSIRNWPERDAVAKITCPRLVFVGDKDAFVAGGYQIRIGGLITGHREELEGLGWQVRIVPGFGHELGARPEVVTPIVAEFLGSVLV
jgi:pimeloyl-ACP methyl ester carboxylesterase